MARKWFSYSSQSRQKVIDSVFDNWFFFSFSLFEERFCNRFSKRRKKNTATISDAIFFFLRSELLEIEFQNISLPYFPFFEIVLLFFLFSRSCHIPHVLIPNSASAQHIECECAKQRMNVDILILCIRNLALTYPYRYNALHANKPNENERETKSQKSIEKNKIKHYSARVYMDVIYYKNYNVCAKWSALIRQAERFAFSCRFRKHMRLLFYLFFSYLSPWFMRMRM